MKRIKSNIAETPLEKAVVRIMNHNANGYESVDGAFQDLMQGGCASGFISELIYYKDTVKFFKRHQAEITKLLSDTMSETGYECPAELFGEKWEKEDPLAHDEMNQNLLAWFGFEETARRIADRVGIEI